jgi:regulator of sigma E protease
MNVLLAILLFGVADAIGRPDYQPVIGTVEAGSPAAQAGLQPGDKIVTIDGQPVKYWSDLVNDVNSAAVKVPANTTTVHVTVVLLHAGSSAPTTVTVNARAHPAQGQGHMGVGPNFKLSIINRVPVWQAPVAGVQELGNVISLTATGIWQVITGVVPLSQAFTGPVGIVQVTGEAASTVPQVGFYPLFYLTAFLSTSLAIVNVLPIPALDGGRVLMVLIEVVRGGKRLKPETEGLINLAGFVVLFALIALITYYDIARATGH